MSSNKKNTNRIPKEDKINESVVIMEGDTLPEEPTPETEDIVMEVVEEPKVEETIPETEEVKEESVQKEEKVDVPEGPAEVPPISVGTKVKLKEGTKKTVVGLDIPKFAFRNIYRVEKILPNRVIIKAGQFTIPVKMEDIEIHI